METATVYWIEPVTVVKAFTKHGKVVFIFGLLFFLLNMASLGLLKFIIAVVMVLVKNRKRRKLGKELYKLRIRLTHFKLSAAMNKMWSERGWGFEV